MLSVIMPHLRLAVELDVMAARTVEQAVKNADHPSQIEMIIVDSGSRKTAAVQVWCDQVMRYASMWLQILDRGLSYAEAANLGLHIARGEIISVLNNDCIPPLHWDTLLEEGMMSAPQGVVTGTDLYRGPVVIADEPWGAFWAMPRVVYQKVGDLDEQFVYGMFEDQDYWCRVHQCGYSVSQYGALVCQHIGSATFQSLPNGPSIYSLNRRYMRRKWDADSYRDWKQSISES